MTQRLCAWGAAPGFVCSLATGHAGPHRNSSDEPPPDERDAIHLLIGALTDAELVRTYARAEATGYPLGEFNRELIQRRLGSLIASDEETQ